MGNPFSRQSLGDSSSDYSSSSESREDSMSLEDEMFDESTSEDEYINKYPHPVLSAFSSEGIEYVMDGIPIENAQDAAILTNARPVYLDLRQVVDIEQQLEIYEKISLIYLLYDNAQEALIQARHVIEDNKTGFLINWAKKQQPNYKWSEKLVEAICCIQNYKILKYYGYDKSYLLSIYPHYCFTSIHLNKLRKVLYFMCENLGQDIFPLLKAVDRDFIKHGLKFEHFISQDYLEIYLLHWELLGYIRNNNINNLYNVLKVINLDLCEDLKLAIPLATVPQQPIKSNNNGNCRVVDNISSNRDIFDKILDDESTLSDLKSIDATETSYTNDESQDNKYYIDPDNPGICLIINQKDFYREPDRKYHRLLCKSEILESRTGTEKDCEKLQNTFLQFGFHVIVHNNLTHSKIIDVIKETVKQIKTESSLFICILSHGEEGVVYGVNSCKVPVKIIKECMCKTNMAGKPKILILQSCQGNECQRVVSPVIDESDDDPENEDDLTTDAPSHTAKVADLFTFWATVPGYGAIRHKKQGSWFIQTLCDKMLKVENKHHFEDICTAIVREVTNKRWKQASNEFTMVPNKESTMTKMLFLPKLKC